MYFGLGEKGKSCMNKFLYLRLVFLTILLKAILGAERNSADNVSIGIQSFSTLRCSSMDPLV